MRMYGPLYTLTVTASIVKELYDSGLDFFDVVFFCSHQLRLAALAPLPLCLSTSVKQGHARIHTYLLVGGGGWTQIIR